MGVFAPTAPAAAAPELRWIAYVRTQQEPVLELKGDQLITVRSDGRSERTLTEGGVLTVDLGPGGLVHAASNQEQRTHPPSSSLIRAWIGNGVEGKEQANTRYYGVAASSEGSIAISRQVTNRQPVPQFLSGGVEALRSTTVPILVPPEEPPGTSGLVPTVEEDSYRLMFTNDPAGELAHAAQVNVFVDANPEELFDPRSDPYAKVVDVRGTDGHFYCGASACFLTWRELDLNYTVGEFGSSEEAVAFAEALVPIESLAGPRWREGTNEPTPTPELVIRDSSGNERLLESAEGSCECGFRPLDWNLQNDRLLVLVSADGYSSLQEYRTDGSGEPATLAEDMADAEGLDLILDAAYGPEGVVALFGAGRPSGTLRKMDGSNALATNVRAFDIEGSTLAYVDAAGDVIVRDLATDDERAVGHGAIDVSVAPDVIRATPTESTPPEEEGPPALLVVVIAAGGVVLLGGAAFLLIARRRQR